MIHIIKIGLKNSYTLTKKFFVQNYIKEKLSVLLKDVFINRRISTIGGG